MHQYDNLLFNLFQIFLKSLVDFYNKTNCIIEETRLIEDTHFNISKLNEISSVKTFNHYDYPLNNGICWNCEKFGYSHSCCVACKQELTFCDCVFICGLTYPTQFDNRKRPCQFKKCRYFTNDPNKIKHECKGQIINNEIVLFMNKNETKRFNIKENITRKYCDRCNSHKHISSDCSQTYLDYYDY